MTDRNLVAIILHMLKIIKTDKLIEALLKTRHSPADFADILQYLNSQGILPNKTTIYRNLEKLEKDGIIKKVILSDHKQFWELSQSNSDHQHYHLICQKCEKIECQDLDQSFQLQPSSFQTQKTELNLYGVCQNCI